jgi:hypothetical protein
VGGRKIGLERVNLVIENGAQRACFKAQVYRAQKGVNPNTIHSFIHSFKLPFVFSLNSGVLGWMNAAINAYLNVLHLVTGRLVFGRALGYFMKLFQLYELYNLKIY